MIELFIAFGAGLVSFLFSRKSSTKKIVEQLGKKGLWIRILEDPILYQHIFGYDFSNPLGMAAGFDKNVEVVNSLLNLGFSFESLNFSFIASITKKPTLCRLFLSFGLGFPRPTKSSIF